MSTATGSILTIQILLAEGKNIYKMCKHAQQLFYMYGFYSFRYKTKWHGNLYIIQSNDKYVCLHQELSNESTLPS